MPHMLQRLTAAWSTVLSNQALRPAYQEGDPNVSATAEDSEAANDDVVMERLLRELTREHLTLLVQLQEQRPASGSGEDSSCLVHRKCCLGGKTPCRLCRPRKACRGVVRLRFPAVCFGGMLCSCRNGCQPWGLGEAEGPCCLTQGALALLVQPKGHRPAVESVV